MAPEIKKLTQGELMEVLKTCRHTVVIGPCPHTDCTAFPYCMGDAVPIPGS